MNDASAIRSTAHSNPRLDALRERMQANNIDAYIILSSDPHLSEYLPEYWQSRAWITGFDGSAGFAAVTREAAALWTDSRYWVQAEAQLQNSGFVLMKQGAPDTPTLAEWIKQQLEQEATVGLDAMTLAISTLQRWSEACRDKHFRLSLDKDLIGEIWKDRPPVKRNPIYTHDEAYCKKTRAEKLSAIRQKLSEKNCRLHLISSVDEIGWLLNLRGSDVEYNPVFLAHLILMPDTALLFVDESCISSELKAQLQRDNVRVLPYHNAAAMLDTLSQNEQPLWIDPERTVLGMLKNMFQSKVLGQLLEPGPQVHAETNPGQLLKACKTEDEIAHIRDAMVQDGVALCRFFSDFEIQLQEGKRLTELDVDAQITAARAECELFVSPSFATIAGFNANGALPHYRATPEHHSVIEGNGLLLIDSGGQYLNGTTDITRVMPIGTPSEQQKADFTCVLRAMIALSMARFPENISGAALDAICRQPLWEQKLNFGHGTGHGVGYFLNVHEGPQTIAYSAGYRADNQIRQGMVTSNEPGLYREGRWGIRIENLVHSRVFGSSEFGSFMEFETLTLCPIDTRCIQRDKMKRHEVEWLNTYHQTVWEKLSPHLDGAAREWLKTRTQPI